MKERLATRREQHRGGFCLFGEEEEGGRGRRRFIRSLRDVGADLFWSVLVCPDLSAGLS